MISSKTIAIVGVGSIGNITAQLTSKEGFELILIDRDIVEEHNLENQSLYSEEDIGKPKAIIAKEKLGAKKAYPIDLTFKNINILDDADLILDCTDNLETRFLINDYCLKNKKPWIYSAGLKTHGTIMNFFPGEVCFRCIFKPVHGLDTCETTGITIKTAEKIAKLQIENMKNNLSEKYMIRFDSDSTERIKVKKLEDCPACNGNYEFLEGEKQTKPAKLCGSNTFQIKGSFRLEESFKIINEKITLFKDGRALIKAETEKEARSLYSKFVGN